MDGEMPDYLPAKDLQIIGDTGAAGATYRQWNLLVNYTATDNGRTDDPCNMAIEAGVKWHA